MAQMYPPHLCLCSPMAQAGRRTHNASPGCPAASLQRIRRRTLNPNHLQDTLNREVQAAAHNTAPVRIAENRRYPHNFLTPAGGEAAAVYTPTVNTPPDSAPLSFSATLLGHTGKKSLKGGGGAPCNHRPVIPCSWSLTGVYAVSCQY